MLCIVPDVVIHKRTLIRVCQAYAPDSGRYPHHSHMSSTDVSPAVSTCPPLLMPTVPAHVLIRRRLQPWLRHVIWCVRL